MGRRTNQFNKLMDDINGRHAKRFNAALETMGQDDFCLNYLKVLEFAAPKLQRTELNSGNEDDNVIKIIHTYEQGTKD